jgi:hypothetical protein
VTGDSWPDQAGQRESEADPVICTVLLVNVRMPSRSCNKLLTGQLGQVQLEPQLQVPEVEHPQSPMMNDGLMFVWYRCKVL